MKINSKSRRQFLVGSANTLVALPFLPSLFPRQLWAQSAPVEKRFIAAWMPLGGYSNTDLYPTYTPEQTLQLYPNHMISYTNLRQSSGLGSISKIYSSALNPYISKLNVLQGLDCPIGFTHGEGTMLGHYRHVRGPGADPNKDTADSLTQYPAVPSIDQHLAFHPQFYSYAPVLRTVAGYGGAGSILALQTPGDINSGLKKVGGALTSPHALFNALFGSSTPPVNQEGPTQKQHDSKTLVDQVLVDLNKTLSHRNISTTDKQRLDSYATELHELQKKLIAVNPNTCSAPADPVLNTSMGSIPDDMTREQFLDLYTSVLVAGMKCGRTRIATLSGILAVATQGKYNFDNLHGWGHNGQKDLVGDAMRWYIEKLYVPLLKKLDVPDGSGQTYLDNSLVLFGNQNTASVHKNWDRPILLAGSAGGFFKTGNFVDYRQPGVNTKYGRPGILYNQLMVSILRSMGVPSTDPMLKHYAYADLIVPPSSQSWWSTLMSNGEHPHKHLIKDGGKLLPVITA